MSMVKKISEERILQLSNDLGENIRSGTRGEWVAVAKYFRDKMDEAERRLSLVRSSVAAMVLAEQMRQQAMSELERWTSTP